MRAFRASPAPFLGAARGDVGGAFGPPMGARGDVTPAPPLSSVSRLRGRSGVTSHQPAPFHRPWAFGHAPFRRPWASGVTSRKPRPFPRSPVSARGDVTGAPPPSAPRGRSGGDVVAAPPPGGLPGRVTLRPGVGPELSASTADRQTDRQTDGRTDTGPTGLPVPVPGPGPVEPPRSPLPLSPAPEPGGPPWGPPCPRLPDRRYQALPSLVCLMCCLFGVVYCFFGYRCFKAVLFLTGLLFGSAVIFLLCYRERVLETQLSGASSAGIALAVGLLCGLVAMLVRSVGLFLLGLLLGLLLATAALLGSGPFYQPATVWTPLGLLLGAGLLCALLALRWPRPLTTLATAVAGAALVSAAVDYFAELLLLGRYAAERLRAAPPGPPLCWRSWALLASWPLLSLVGVVVQWRVTADGYSHTDVVIRRQQRRVQLMRIRQREERKVRRRPPSRDPRALRPPDPAYRRRPVPVKRFNGDVLSPSYIQSFRDRQTGSSLSSFVAAPPADLDYECGSTVPLTAASAAPGPPVRV
ncbi:transmembrane protein 198 [Tachyglossus aculeatus]|uniref:transmembrane protein 198 n=1 Tax=Tachyglossus aculeatus TaxID=9261 RepID=UPI0018F60BA8|nr:transmembrane protein 198 [Tachyglossus aculeatus]